MTASEFVFLAFGLVLGLSAGASLIMVLRARPPAPREIRVTVAQDAIPRRATTLADDAFTMPGPEPARGGPADRRGELAGPPVGTSDRRTPVRSDGPFRLAAAGAGGGPGSSVADFQPDAIGMAVDRGIDPMLQALRESAARSAESAMRTLAPTAVMDRPEVRASSTSNAGASTGAPPTEAPSGPCADERRLADERCELAGRARAQATLAENAHREAQRAYDDHDARSEQAAAAADPRAIRRAKDEAQARFRAARGGAQTTEEVEAAARAWLLEINQINADARDATATLTREREAARALLLDLERIAMEAEAARIGAETAEAACLAARESVASCEEAATTPVGDAPARPAGPPGGGGGSPDDEQLAAALGTGGTPRIFRLVRGDRSAMVEIVAAMAGDDPGERRRWQLALSDLVDAILADSISVTSLQFPIDHSFWGPFTVEQNRDIAGALSSLGYRFDGLGGWVDGRVPSQRDLSLALGYAGIDPMRIRQWPTESGMHELFNDVVVAADERLAGAAGDLTLGELVTMLGRRADGLADLWNEWGRLRPLLLEES